MKNNLKNKIKNGDTLIGTWSSLSSANVINVLGTTKLDFVVIDMEHGSMSLETAEDMVRSAEASNISPVIRTWDDNSQTILRCLETGVKSLMVPHVKTALQAENVVKACRYFPEGNRGLSPYTRNHCYDHNDIEISLKRANEDTFVGILVEGKEGLENLEEISSVDGIDLIYLGLFDICQSVGLPGQLDNKKVIKEIDRCCEIITSHSIAAGAMSTNIDYIRMLKSKNINL